MVLLTAVLKRAFVLRFPRLRQYPNRCAQADSNLLPQILLYKMNNKIKIILLPLFLILISSFAFGQKNITEQSYNLDILSAKYIETNGNNEVLLIFKYEPKKKKEFKPIFSMKITYSIGNSQDEKTEILEKSNHSIVFYGNDIDTKNPEIFNLIKDKINLEQKQKFGIVVFHLRNLTTEYFDKIKFTYGLWEPENEKIRIEKTYKIEISKC